jgi:hypothetical protein
MVVYSHRSGSDTLCKENIREVLEHGRYSERDHTFHGHRRRVPTRPGYKDSSERYLGIGRVLFRDRLFHQGEGYYGIDRVAGHISMYIPIITGAIDDLR